jgi:hypothetical protein
LLSVADMGLEFVKNLRACGFSKGLECETKLLILKCKALTSKKIDMPKDKRAKEFETASLRLLKLMSETSNDDLINQELPVMLYNQKLSTEGLKEAREFLDQIEKGALGFDSSNIKEDWIKSQKAWLTYSFIEEISKDKEEQGKII